MSYRLKEGKVPWELIAAHLDAHLPDRVVLGPGLGEDAALLTMGNETWAAASDPISFTTCDAGRLCVLVNANDVAVRGARPQLFLAVLLIAPSEATADRVSKLLAQIRKTCDQYGIALIGGHTEVTPGISHSVVVGTALGRVIDRPLTTSGLNDGDLIGMTKWAGLEGTAILLGDLGERLVEIHGQQIQEARRQLDGDWISVVKEAALAAANPHVSALHDVTEGGVGQALTEIAEASGLDLDVDLDRVPMLPVTRIICSDLGLDPLGLIGSGAMLVGCAEAGEAALKEAFANRGIPFSWIGRAQAKGSGAAPQIPGFPRDEILKLSIVEGVEAVVFDMDGTLIDTTYNWSEIRRRLGLTKGSILDQLSRLPFEGRERKQAILGELEKQATEAARLKPGTTALLALVEKKGKKCALVTNNTTLNTEVLIRRFSLRFDAVVTRDSGVWKPSGDPFTVAAAKLGLATEQCLAVGDYIYDFLAARSAGCKGAVSVFDTEAKYANLVDAGFDDLFALARFFELLL